MDTPAQRLIVGLTGGIGSGKTAVSNVLGQLGADVIDTDVIAHQLTAAGGAAMPAITAAFGPQARQADGSMDRAFIRQRVFGDAEALQTLESILHPMIRATCQERLRSSHGSYALLVIPLLIEKQGWGDLLNATVVVDCPPDEQIRRVQQRSGLAPDEIRRIMARQASREQRLAAATHVIRNDADLAHLQAQAQALHDTLLAQSKLTFARPS